MKWAEGSSFLLHPSHIMLVSFVIRAHFIYMKCLDDQNQILIYFHSRKNLASHILTHFVGSLILSSKGANYPCGALVTWQFQKHYRRSADSSEGF